MIMSSNERRTRAAALATAGLFAMSAVAVTIAASAGGPLVKPAAVAQKTATAPPADATTTNVAGKNKVAVPVRHDASLWIEQIDIDGDGNVDDANLVWDDVDKVLFASKSGTFTCRNGGTGSGDMLIAVNGAGNRQHQPAGSGFWIADVDKGECGARAGAVVGCLFDARGNDTTCGLVDIDEKTGEVVIAAVK